MARLKCPYCGEDTKRFGKTRAGTQRWRCLGCGATFTHKIDNTAKLLKEFLSWLFSKTRQCDMVGGGRSFRRKTSRFWEIWPMPPLIDEIFPVVFVDGIYLARNVVVLIARSEQHVLGWYVARSENSASWEALLSRIAAPDMVVTDGGSGFEKARRRVWNQTRVQRCTFHAFCQVKRYTTSRPKLPAGAELFGIACDLLHVKDADQAASWLVGYSSWCTRWEGFLAEKSLSEGRLVLTHERLVKARDGLTRLVRQQVLFTFLDPVLTADGRLPATNNAIEGGVNAQLRHMLRDHRGLSLMRRIKAVYWWCYMHTECPLSPAELLKVMPTDADIEGMYRDRVYGQQHQEGAVAWGDGLVWGELHHSSPWRMDWD